MVSFHIIPLAYKKGSHLLITKDFSTKRYSSSATFLQNGFQATQWRSNKQMQQKACFKTGVIIKGIICKFCQSWKVPLKKREQLIHLPLLAILFGVPLAVVTSCCLLITQR